MSFTNLNYPFFSGITFAEKVMKTNLRVTFGAKSHHPDW